MITHLIEKCDVTKLDGSSFLADYGLECEGSDGRTSQHCFERGRERMREMNEATDVTASANNLGSAISAVFVALCT